MTIAVDRNDDHWVDRVVESVSYTGLSIVEGVLDKGLVDNCRSAMYAVQKKIQADVGNDRLAAAEEVGVLRLMLRYDDFFFRLLELPEMLADVPDEESVREIVKDLNHRIAGSHRIRADGPPIVIGLVNVEQAVAEWRCRRS